MSPDVEAAILCMVDDAMSILRDADMTSMAIEVGIGSVGDGSDDWCIACVRDDNGRSSLIKRGDWHEVR